MTSQKEQERKTADKEKNGVALSSVLAAVFITALKLIIGILTNSLGILAEAAHSGLDLVAAGVTLFAVRMSGKPADKEHQFGHGKIENLSALFEAFLLLITCIWIIYEAINRLFFESVMVQVSFWSFFVMGVSIIVDASRSKALMRMAKKHRSQALEADALHFSTDIWSSSVVIVGLAFVTLGEYLQSLNSIPSALIHWLYRADSIAALGVSAIVIYISIELGIRTIQGLLDQAPAGMVSKVENAVSDLPGVRKVTRVRIRPSGPVYFIDLTLAVGRDASLEEAHQVAEQAESIVEGLLPRSDVVVHIDPVVVDDTSLVESIQSVAARHRVKVHGIHVHDIKGKIGISIHVEVADELSLKEAHQQVTAFEMALHDELPTLGDVVTHIEPLGDATTIYEEHAIKSKDIKSIILQLATQFHEIINCHSITVNRIGPELTVSFHCEMPPELTIRAAHSVATALESKIRRKIPELDRVTIHMEPTGNQESMES